MYVITSCYGVFRHVYDSRSNHHVFFVRVILSPMVNRVYMSLRFDIFPSEFTICDVAPESSIKKFMPFSWFGVFVINILSYIMSSVMLFADSFPAFFFL